MLYRGDPGETFCLALAEAQAMGVPAVVHAAGLGRRSGSSTASPAEWRQTTTTLSLPRSRCCATTRCGGAGTWRRSRQQRGLELGHGRGAVRGADRVTRRLLQAIAGARHGGAETFFVRLATALAACRRDAAGADPPRSGARDEPARGGRGVAELAFGGPLDLCDAARLSPRDRRLAAGHRADLDEPGDPALPARRFRACCAARGVLRFEILPALRSSDRQHARHRRLRRRTGLAPRRIDYLPNFVPDVRAAASRCCAPSRRRGGCAASAGARSAASEQGVRRAARGAGEDAGRFDLWLAGEGPLRAALEQLARASRDRRPRAAFSAGARTCRHCSPMPICSSARRGTSRLAMS